MTFAEYAARQAEENAAVMARLDEQTETVADELREVSEKIAALQEAINNAGIDEGVANALLAQTQDIGTRVSTLTAAVENILPEPGG